MTTWSDSFKYHSHFINEKTEERLNNLLKILLPGSDRGRIQTDFLIQGPTKFLIYYISLTLTPEFTPIVNDAGETALDIARKKQHKECEELVSLKVKAALDLFFFSADPLNW
jgi:hypothetical protein